MGQMRDSDWSREILLRSDWLGPRVALITTVIQLDALTIDHELLESFDGEQG